MRLAPKGSWRRHWKGYLRNMVDGARGLARRKVGLPVCGARHPRLDFQTCDRPPLHRGDHFDRAGLVR